jgi:phage-related protein
MKFKNISFLVFVTVITLLLPAIGYCSVESTLGAIQGKLINTILPLCAVLGLVFAAFSFFTGNPNARSHLWLAIIGMIVGFGAPSIMTFVRGIVN